MKDYLSIVMWLVSSVLLAIMAVVVLMILGEVYGGTDVSFVDSSNGDSSGAGSADSGTDVRNASVILGAIGAAALVGTFVYFRSTGRTARRRFAEQRTRQLAASRREKTEVSL